MQTIKRARKRAASTKARPLVHAPRLVSRGSVVVFIEPRKSIRRSARARTFDFTVSFVNQMGFGAVKLAQGILDSGQVRLEELVKADPVQLYPIPLNPPKPTL